MKFYFAPLEGITGYIYRNTHKKYFDGVDAYFTPFVSPTSAFNFKSREKRDVLPENNEGTPVIPQILTNHADQFLYTGKCLMEYGYKEINLNLGCPSGTVTSKGRGSGFLSKTDELDCFLDEIFSKADFPISIKTRIGKDSPEEFPRLMEIYNQYPIRELTIHPRIRNDFYKNKPNWDVFEEACKVSKNPICYNGDINTVEDYEIFCKRFPAVDTIMIGRGLIGNPGLLQEIQSGEKTDLVRCKDFILELRQEYGEIMAEIPVLFKMKEIWSYMNRCFPDSEKLWKSIKKTKKLSEYDNIIRVL